MRICHARAALVVGAVALVGCTTATAPSPPQAGTWSLRDGHLVLAVTGDLTLWRPGRPARRVDRNVQPGLVLTADRETAVYVRRPPAPGGGQLWAADLAGGRLRALSNGHAAGLPTLSPVGRRVAFIDSSPQGIASLFVVPLDGSRPPLQLTNRGLVRRGPGPPAGFAPVPTGAAGMSWDHDGIRIEAQGRRWHIDPGAGR